MTFKMSPMPSREEAARQEATSLADRATAYAKFAAKPEVKLLVSMIPAGAPDGVVDTLLRVCFDAGWVDGGSNQLMYMVEKMLNLGMGHKGAD